MRVSFLLLGGFIFSPITFILSSILVHMGTDMKLWQKTLRQVIEVSGVGLHSGRFIEAELHPAPIGHGIIFYRTDIVGRDPIIPATIAHAVPGHLSTRIANSDGVGINTIEHFMAAFHGCGIDNVRIEIDGPELPIFDGSAAPIISRLHHAGIIEQDMLKPILVITKPVAVDLGNNVRACLAPPDHSTDDHLSIGIEIDFEDSLIGTQSLLYVHKGSAHFESELAHARTFCMLHDVETIRNAGLGRGGSLDNAIIVHEGGVLNEGGLRSDDEFVRHKTLDCLGDLYLLGMTVRGHLTATRPGHFLSAKLLQQLMATPDAYYIENETKPSHLSHYSYPETAVAAHS